jgi:hypothetical protein
MYQQIGTLNVVAAARAEALFASGLSASSRPTRGEVDASIRWAVQRFRGSRGCAGEAAAAYGDYPETAVGRMRWARAVVAATYPIGRPRLPRLIVAGPTGGGPDRRTGSAVVDHACAYGTGHFVNRGVRLATALPAEPAAGPAMAGSRA